MPSNSICLRVHQISHVYTWEAFQLFFYEFLGAVSGLLRFGAATSTRSSVRGVTVALTVTLGAAQTPVGFELNERAVFIIQESVQMGL
jgi:hypothetical protein